MNGVHDMGGIDGFGKVESEPNEPVFHEKWEGRVMAMTRAMGANGGLNIDMQRFSRESLAPDVYLTSSYYKNWLLSLQQLLVDRALVSADEIEAGHALRPGKSLKHSTFTLHDVNRVMTRSKFDRPASGPAEFKLGERVRAKNIHPQTHTRLPRYVRGHVGIVELIHGCHVFPDTSANDQGDNPQWLYTIVFESRELWGPDADPTIKISIDAFEPYLDRA